MNLPGLPGTAAAVPNPELLSWQALRLPDGEHLAWCEGGDPQGLPVLVIHGGPGGRTRGPSLQWWQGLPVRWIAYDQRGCGRSSPRGSLQGQALATLLADIECLRAHLGLARWAVAAGSWGSLLALGYAGQQPQAVLGLFLRSSFTGSQAELLRYMAPWEQWLGPQGCGNLGAAAGALRQLLCHGGTAAGAPDPALAQDAVLASAWAAFDAAQTAPGGVLVSGHRWQPGLTPAEGTDLLDWGIFLQQAQQAWGVGAQGVRWPGPMPGPCSLVHGQADAVCDPAVSQRLAQHWPRARWHSVPGGAHAMSQAPMAAALQRAAVEWVADLA
jgi:proline iminopeptidase